jgi:aminoglycoside 3-N-acetyltransferase
LLGVSHAENTTMHLAEVLAGVPYSVAHPCVVERDGEAVTILIDETDHCCEGFRRADSWLRQRGLQREGRVGSAWSRLVRSRDVVRVVLEALEAEPLVFLCAAGAGCDECDAARAGVRVAPG